MEGHEGLGLSYCDYKAENPPPHPVLWESVRRQTRDPTATHVPLKTASWENHRERRDVALDRGALSRADSRSRQGPLQTERFCLTSLGGSQHTRSRAGACL